MFVNFSSGHANKGPIEKCVRTFISEDIMGPADDIVSSNSKRFRVVDQLSEELEGYSSSQDASRFDNGDRCMESRMGSSSRPEESSRTVEQGRVEMMAVYFGIKCFNQQLQNKTVLI